MSMANTESKNQILGAFWKIASCFCFAAINGIVRYINGGAGDESISPLPVYVIIFFQNLIGTLFMLPFIMNSGLKSLKTNRPFLHITRVIVSVGGVGLWYWGLYYLPMAQAVALSFTGPIFTVIGAHLFLKEEITFNRIVAIIVCFAGAFLIVRPDETLFAPNIDSYSWTIFLPLGAAVAFAVSKLLSRVLASHGESADSMTFYLLVLMAPISFVPAMPEWITPTLAHWPWLMAMGVLAAGAHYTLTKSLALAEVSFIMPFGYSKIIISAAIGYVAFAEVPSSITIWMGSLIIFLSAGILSLPDKKILKMNAA